MQQVVLGSQGSGTVAALPQLDSTGRDILPLHVTCLPDHDTACQTMKQHGCLEQLQCCAVRECTGAWLPVRPTFQRLKDCM